MAPPEGATDLLTAARAAVPPPRPGLTADDIALISYTSGTSGPPKGATNTHGNIGHNAERQRVTHALPEGCGYFALAPLFHITGMVCQLATCLANAGTSPSPTASTPASSSTPSPSTAPPTPSAPPPPSWRSRPPGASRDHFTSLEVISSGGAPLPPALVDRFEAGFGPYIRNGYGLTECTAPCAAVPPGKRAPVDPVSGTLAVGVPGPDTDVRIVDADGRDVPFGAHGEIAVRGRWWCPGTGGGPRRARRRSPGRTAHRRHRLHGRERLAVRGRPQEGHDQRLRLQGLAARGRGRPVHPPAVREAAVVGVPDPTGARPSRRTSACVPASRPSPRS
ncbi:AMP-binding protein [Streptomyces sp. M19]